MNMVTTLEKISPVGKLSDCLAISQSSVAKDQKLDISGQDRNIGVYRNLSSSVNQNQKMQPDVHMDSAYCKMDRHLVGIIGAQNESSLFSSSLSELVDRKLRLSANKFLSRESSTFTSHGDKVEAFESHEETEGQTINNLLPDEEELFSGMVGEMEHLRHANTSDDLEDFDLFTCSGGIELETDDHLKPGQGNVGYPWGHPQDISRIHSSPHESSGLFNNFLSPVGLQCGGDGYGLRESSQSFSRLQLDNRCIPTFHPHSPQLQLHTVPGFADDMCPRVPEKVNLDIRHLSLNGHAMELNEGVFGRSPNGLHVYRPVESKSNSYQNHHPRSLLVPNSPSFLNNNHAHHLGRLPGSPGAPHMMMNMASPSHLQVGSPVIKASLLDRQQSHELSGYPMGMVGGVAIPRFSTSHPREIFSHNSLPHIHGTCTEMSNNVGLHSPQQMSHLFHERNSMNSLPTSFGSPSERVRSRKNETNLGHSDRKHYELNIDRILRGEDNRTTLMIKNIPNKYTSKMLLATIDEHHRGKYDFIYLPIDFKNKCNMGYAFINMVDPLKIVAFHQTFEGRKWEKFNSEKVATLAYARIQGKASLVAHFQNSSLMNEDKRCRPILFHTDGPNAGEQEPFPVGNNLRPKPGRLPLGGSEEDE